MEDKKASGRKLKSSSKRKNQAHRFTCACSVCEMKFTFASNLHRHMKNVHKKMEICSEEGCTFQCFSRREFLLHRDTEHRPRAERQELKFKNIEEFYAWKLKEEVQNFVCYTKRRGDIEMVSSHHEFYICYLSRRAAASKKLQKTDLFCPSRMLLKQSKVDGSVRVTYYRTHSHVLTYSGTQQLPIPECLRFSIKEKLKSGLTAEQVNSQLRKENQTQLAVSIAMYNRLQRFDMTHISMIERAMIKKGLLGGKMATKDLGEMIAEDLQQPDGIPVVDGEIVNDGEVQMDIESGESLCGDLLLLPGGESIDAPPKKTALPFISDYSISDKRPKKAATASIPKDDTVSLHVSRHVVVLPCLENVDTIDAGEIIADSSASLTPQLRDKFTEALLLLKSKSYKNPNLQSVEDGLKELLDICQ